MKKNYRELDHSDILKIYSTLKLFTSTLAFKSFFSRMAWFVWLKFCMKHKWDRDIQKYQNKKKRSLAELVHSDC